MLAQIMVTFHPIRWRYASRFGLHVVYYHNPPLLKNTQINIFRGIDLHFGGDFFATKAPE